MSWIKKAAVGVGIVVIVLIALFLHYTLPRTAVVQISGTDIKRVGTKDAGVEKQPSVDTNQQMKQPTTDVRFINSVSRKGKTMVLRNEDTGWGWPPYFKFNSADITAEAQAYATDPVKPWVLIKYYGWRFRVTSMFPNVLNLRVVDRNHSHIPIFNIVVIGLLLAAVFFIRKKIMKLVSWMRDRGKPETVS